MAAKKCYTRAYVLVYIRESDVDEMLASMSPGDIPPHIKRHLDGEKAQNEMHLTVKIVTDKIFKVHQGFDLANFDDKTMQSEIPSFRVKEEERFAVFKQSVADHFQVPVNRFRLWILVKRLNRTVRPDQPIPETEANSSMIAIKDKMGNRSTLQLYLEEADKPINGRLWSYQMIFLKYFDPKTQKIEFGLWQAICAAERECLRYHPHLKREERVPIEY
ncbi:ICP0-binding domain of ubiquitin-specific protease 7-domain-containing protein [Jimgerdemannia flammicorona]|uniref:ICP0-binding domain of ubiquitin-specific protease 7-domain-containing protein n=1 Tax=Jimgerdemannia flammicorona TaxID=994334 RepID=A0A433QR66_9FUNG|nr:ICP0-binding domain of ubiquitin-specific protease 7-domain-containing protein [Jimgerdemannia flammicorona]